MTALETVVDGSSISTVQGNSVNNPVVFTVTSDGRTDADFIGNFKEDNCYISDFAMDVLQKVAFIATNGKTYRLGLIMWDEFSTKDWTIKNVRAEAARRGWFTPPLEAALLLYEKVPNEEMKRLNLVWLMVMHEPIVDSVGNAYMLCLDCFDGDLCLDTVECDELDDKLLPCEHGFLFLLP